MRTLFMMKKVNQSGSMAGEFASKLRGGMVMDRFAKRVAAVVEKIDFMENRTLSLLFMN